MADFVRQLCDGEIGAAEGCYGSIAPASPPTHRTATAFNRQSRLADH